MITFNKKLEVTDHDLRLLAESWEKSLPTKLGSKTSFAAGFKIALSKVKEHQKANCVHPYDDIIHDNQGLTCTKCNTHLTN